MKTKLIKTVLIVFAVTMILSCKTVTLKGKIAVKGNEPHTYLVLILEQNLEYAIVGDLRQEIWTKYQGQVIKVRGKIVKQAVGPGFPAELEVSEILQ